MTPARGLGEPNFTIDGHDIDIKVADALTGASLTRSMDGGSTVQITLDDPDRVLIQSPLFVEDRLLGHGVKREGHLRYLPPEALSEATITVDDMLFTLRMVDKAGDTLTLTFEDSGVYDLRKHDEKKVAGAALTRVEFAKKLVDEVGWLDFEGDDTKEGKKPVRQTLSRGGTSGGGPHETSWDALQRLAGDRQWRCFSDGEGTIFFGSDDWLIHRVVPLRLSEDSKGIYNIDISSDINKVDETATITCEAFRWAVQPGYPVLLDGLGPLGKDPWLVSEISRENFFMPQTTVALVRRRKSKKEPSGDPSDPGVGPSGFGWVYPLTGVTTTTPNGGFGAPRSTPSPHSHEGNDFTVGNGKCGVPIHAALAGKVTFAGLDNPPGFGSLIKIDHGQGWESWYAHMQGWSVHAGQTVRTGQVIAHVGSMGNAGTFCHLHFEIHKDGVPVDPAPILANPMQQGPKGQTAGKNLYKVIPGKNVKQKIRTLWGVEAGLAIKVFSCESGLSPHARSSANAWGITQIKLDAHPTLDANAIRSGNVDYQLRAGRLLYEQCWWYPWDCAKRGNVGILNQPPGAPYCGRPPH